MLENPFLDKYSKIKRRYASLLRKNSVQNKVIRNNITHCVSWFLIIVSSSSLLGAFFIFYFNIQLSMGMKLISIIALAIISAVLPYLYFRYYEIREKRQRTGLYLDSRPYLQEMAVILRDYQNTEDSMIAMERANGQCLVKDKMHEKAAQLLSDDPKEVINSLEYILSDSYDSLECELTKLRFKVLKEIKAQDNLKQKREHLSELNDKLTKL